MILFNYIREKMKKVVDKISFGDPDRLFFDTSDRRKDGPREVEDNSSEGD